MSQKLALFDVDKTIISIDSMFAFLLYGLGKRPYELHRIGLAGVNSILYKLGVMNADRAKSAYFGAIRHMDEDDLKRFYENKLKPRIYPGALAEMDYRKQQGYHVLLVTASPAAYMKYFNELEEVDGVIGTDLVMEEGRYTGRIHGNNCKGEEKVLRIRQYLAENGITPDFDQSCAYSDSLSDMPMLRMVKHKYLINRKQVSDCEGLTWNF